jgi:hypothetical protein
MHGNVWEWVQDCWHSDYNGAPTDGSAWESGDGATRVIRGGGWYDDAGGCRSAYRYHFVPRIRSVNLGFRILKEPYYFTTHMLFLSALSEGCVGVRSRTAEGATPTIPLQTGARKKRINILIAD